VVLPQVVDLYSVITIVARCKVLSPCIVIYHLLLSFDCFIDDLPLIDNMGKTIMAIDYIP
jgi:uncharacterized membrane protein